MPLDCATRLARKTGAGNQEMTYFIDLRADSAGGNPVASAMDVVVRTDQQRNPNPAQPLDATLVQAVQGRDVLLGTHGFHVNRDNGIDNAYGVRFRQLVSR